ncbi:MAG: Acetophenone carboxylase gamma subunit [Planctomycetota bacterium]
MEENIGKPKLKIWVDVGGTFTDAIAWFGDHTSRSVKVLSSGKIRCEVSQLQANGILIVGNLPPSGIDFWKTCPIYLLAPNGTKQSLGNIHSSGIDWIKLDAAIPPNSLSVGDWLELSSGLESPVLATHLLLDVPIDHPLPSLEMRIGTTRGTNALLTRAGAAVGLFITKGFGDLPKIGNQDRPDLFALRVTKPAPLVEAVMEIDERLAADGSIITPLSLSGVQEKLTQWKRSGIRAVAITLLHSYLNPTHEHLLAKLAHDAGFEEVICSADITPQRRLVSRCDTTCVDGYLSPIVRDYLRTVSAQLGDKAGANLQIMTSAGALVPASDFRGKDSVLSGPAGGIVAVQDLLHRCQSRAALAFDMGGTSTDVSRCTQQQLPLQFDTWKAGVRIVTPILSIHTVAAGGGSICYFDGVQMHVGPASAGSHPGPACYGQGGPLTLTDINLLLGIIPDEAFPIPINRDAAAKALGDISEEIRRKQSVSLSDYEIAQGFRDLANQCMADAISLISTRQGCDPREHLLVGFGGAAGQHQCDLADTLGITEILDPPLAGLFSAAGIGLAQHRQFAQLPIYQALDSIDWCAVDNAIATQTDQLISQLNRLGYHSDEIQTELQLELRYIGTDSTLLIPWCNREQIHVHFSAEHQRHFGYIQPERRIELCAIRFEAAGKSAAVSWPTVNTPSKFPSPLIEHFIWRKNQARKCWKIDRQQIATGEQLEGPGIIMGRGHTTYVSEGWSALLDNQGVLRLKRQIIDKMENRTNSEQVRNRQIDQSERSPIPNSILSKPVIDPIFRDIIAQRLATIAQSMGEKLERTAVSVNIKERRDFSCAVFTANGYLVANAPHVPVHLGAMGETVRSMLQRFPDMKAGDVLLTNDPNCGGSHLPDITVVTPVHDPITGKRIFFTACRAHHAEVGGITAGSMPPDAISLEQEGVLLSPQYLVRDGIDQFDEILRQLKGAKHPSRSPVENQADLIAQQAANQHGVIELQNLMHQCGAQRLEEAMQQVLEASADRVQTWIQSLPTAPLSFEDTLDDGTIIRVNITKHVETESSQVGCDRTRLKIDFAGTSPRHPRNFNANPAIVTAALLYTIRLLAGDDLPLNEGALRDIELQIPTSILRPISTDATTIACDSLPAVAAGNVETSQRVVDVLLGAFGVAAASQGTMNNLLFGDASFGYYETICGGTGATALGAGCSAIHSHMTNTRITDPEILEIRYPVRLIEFAIRKGSGGEGRFPGGDGVIRTIEFLRRLQVSLLSSRRQGNAPYGLAGGKSGTLGENVLRRRSGETLLLPGTCQLEVDCGDQLTLKTPGGGGYGVP